MPTTRIEIENANNRWVAEVETGGIVARRTHHVAATFDEIMGMVSGAWHAAQPKPVEPPAPEPVAEVVPEKRGPGRPKLVKPAEPTPEPEDEPPQAA